MNSTRWKAAVPPRRWPYATGPPGLRRVGLCHGGRSLRRRSPARRASSQACQTAFTGHAPLQSQQTKYP
jgi:hypothetical protein